MVVRRSRTALEAYARKIGKPPWRCRITGVDCSDCTYRLRRRLFGRLLRRLFFFCFYCDAVPITR